MCYTNNEPEVHRCCASGFCYNCGMPNAHKTPARAVRVSDELWSAVQAKAASLGVTVTSVILNALEEFVSEELDNVAK